MMACVCVGVASLAIGWDQCGLVVAAHHTADDGTAYAWGRNRYGQCDIPKALQGLPTPEASDTMGGASLPLLSTWQMGDILPTLTSSNGAAFGLTEPVAVVEWHPPGSSQLRQAPGIQKAGRPVSRISHP